MRFGARAIKEKLMNTDNKRRGITRSLVESINLMEAEQGDITVKNPKGTQVKKADGSNGPYLKQGEGSVNIKYKVSGGKVYELEGAKYVWDLKDVTLGEEAIEEAMGLPVGIGDEVESALGYIEELDGVFQDLEDAVNDFTRNFRSAKIKLKHDPKKSVSALKKAISAVSRDLSAAERAAYKHYKDNY
jgi:hypothetical protein